MYLSNFTVDNKTFCLSLHHNDDSSYLFVDGKGIIDFKSKDSEIVPYPLCLGDILKEFSPLNMLDNGLYDMFMILVLIIGLLEMIKY